MLDFMLRASRLLAAASASAGALLVAACGEDGGAGSGATGDRMTVVATTTHAADLARNVGGDGVEVVGLIAPNADPHDYEVRPRDVEALANADVVVRSGGDLDEWLAEAIEGAGSDAPVLTLLDEVQTIAGGEPAPEAEEHAVDPHWWHDPRNAIAAVGAIRGAMARADPEGARTYERNAQAYTADLEALDEAVASCLAAIPEDERKLVTTHDALGYYANRYDLEVVGTVIPSLSTAGQPSAGETAELVETIREEDVRAIFAESSVNASVEQAIADETGAVVGEALWADTLGPEGSTGETYLHSMAANTQAIAGGLTGGQASCRLPAT